MKAKKLFTTIAIVVAVIVAGVVGWNLIQSSPHFDKIKEHIGG